MLELSGSGSLSVPYTGSYPAAAGFKVFIVK
jgi:hypothetical protein